MRSWVCKDRISRRTAMDLLDQMDLHEVLRRLSNVELCQKNSQKDSREQLGV